MNKITHSERAKIDQTTAAWLLAGESFDTVVKRLQSKHSISNYRARTSIARVIRKMRKAVRRVEYGGVNVAPRNK